MEHIELSQCSTVYEATAVRRRAVAERVLGLERVGEPQRLQDAIGSFFKRKSGTAETVAQLREYWDQLDHDRDGELELHEVEAFLRKIGTTEHVSIDMDSDGKISFAEFERWWAKHPELRESNVFAAATELESAWADIDTDGSGSLDADELRAVLETMGIALGEAGIAQLIEQLDTDGDGEISQAEFMAFWRKQSTAARARLTRSTIAEPEPEDAEGEEPSQPERSTAAIGLVTVVPGSSKQKRHLLFCDTQQEMERWLGVLQEHQRFHHNYDRDALEWGEFLLGMGQVKSTPLGARFACFASAMQSATASLASAVDEERAKELLSGLGLMERVGVRVLQREQRKRDRSELLSRLQRARHNQLHVLSGPEQQQIKHIERHGASHSSLSLTDSARLTTVYSCLPLLHLRRALCHDLRPLRAVRRLDARHERRCPRADKPHRTQPDMRRRGLVPTPSSIRHHVRMSCRSARRLCLLGLSACPGTTGRLRSSCRWWLRR